MFFGASPLYHFASIALGTREVSGAAILIVPPVALIWALPNDPLGEPLGVTKTSAVVPVGAVRVDAASKEFAVLLMASSPAVALIVAPTPLSCMVIPVAEGLRAPSVLLLVRLARPTFTP